MDSALIKYFLLGLLVCTGAGCIAMLVIAGTIHWNIFFYAFFPDYVAVPSIILLSTSCLLLGAAALGVFGVLKDKNLLLKVFAGLVCVLMIVQLAGGVIALDMETTLNGPLQSNMIQSQAKYNVSSEDTNIWNDVQREYYCCGVNSYTEWGKNIPQACTCRVNGEPCIEVPNNGKIYSLGCFPRLRDYVHGLEVILGALAISFIAFHMFCILAAFLIDKANAPPVPRNVNGDC